MSARDGEWYRVSLLCSLALVVGCAKEAEKKPAAAVGARDAGAKAAATARRKPPEAGANPAERDGRAFLDRWLKAQNEGDFAAYSALYAPDFKGVRRSGTSVKTFDRAGWLSDRKRMFAKKMTVKVDNPVAKAEGDRITIEFEQTWESGSYADKGPKRIVLAGGLVVVEEMLASTLRVVPGSSCADAVVADPADRKHVRDTEVFQPDGSKFQVCVLDKDDGGTGEFEIALLEGKGNTWVVRGKTISFPFTRTSKKRSSASAEVLATLEAISPDEEALLVQVDTEEQSVGGGGSRTTRARQLALFRLVDQLEPLVEASSTREDDDNVDFETGEELELVVEEGETRGYHDIVVKTTWRGPMEEEEPDTVYRWNGSGYAAK